MELSYLPGAYLLLKCLLLSPWRLSFKHKPIKALSTCQLQENLSALPEPRSSLEGPSSGGSQMFAVTPPCSLVPLCPLSLWGCSQGSRCSQGWGLGLGASWGGAVLAASEPAREGPISNTTKILSAPARLQVKSVNLSEGELLSIRGVDGSSLTILANHTLLVEGQVIRSPTNSISVYFRTFQDDGLGTFQLHYQGRSQPRLFQMQVLPQVPSAAKDSNPFSAWHPSGSLLLSLEPALDSCF